MLIFVISRVEYIRVELRYMGANIITEAYWFGGVNKDDIPWLISGKQGMTEYH